MRADSLKVALPMRSSSDSKAGRGKPAVATANAAEAEGNLRRKLGLLTEALSQLNRPSHIHSARSPEMMSALAGRAFPITVRQFNLWSSDALPADLRALLPSFRRNASTTLKGHGQLFASVEEVLVALRRALRTPTPESRREHTVASLRRRINTANTMRQITERELVSSRREVQNLKESLAIELNRRVALERELGAAIQRLEAELAQTRARKDRSIATISHLVKTTDAPNE